VVHTTFKITAGCTFVKGDEICLAIGDLEGQLIVFELSTGEESYVLATRSVVINFL
jgi:hypothetical protein